MYPAPNFQQVPITALHLPASVMAQMQFPATLTACSHRTSNIAKLGPELSASPKTSMLAWKRGGISALLGSRFAAVNQSLFCCSSCEPSLAKAQAVTGQKRRWLYTSSPLSANKWQQNRAKRMLFQWPSWDLWSTEDVCLCTRHTAFGSL